MTTPITGSRILVCGGRDFADIRHETQERADREYRFLCRVLDDLRPSFVLVGANEDPDEDCGADLAARLWCRTRGVHHFTAPALWKTKGKAAGPQRNKLMAHAIPMLGITVCVGFPGGPGTAGMCEEAAKQGATIWRPVMPDGTRRG